MPNNPLDFPEELIVKILSHLDTVSLARCSMTCKSIYESIKNSSQLAYTIQLYPDGLKDTGISASHADRLEYLLRQRQAWLSLEWAGTVTLEIAHDGYASDLVRDAFVYTNGHRIAEIISLPTSNNVKKYTSQNARTGTLVMTFTMDPTQDMIALLYDDESRPSLTDTRIVGVHIRTMSTDIPHPLAREGCFVLTIYPYPGVFTRNLPLSPCLYIAHNILVLTFCGLQEKMRLLIWDWTTAELILDSSVAFDPLIPLLSPGYGFSLLDSTYCFFISPVKSGSIRLYQYIRPSGINSPAIHLATLRLPPTFLGTYITFASTQTGPIMAYPNPSSSLAVNDEDRLHVFNISYRNEDWPMTGVSTNMFVHQRVFMQYISHSAHFRGGPLDVPWLQWGPQNTRIIYPAYTPNDPQWHRCLHGQRVVQHLRGVDRRPGAPASRLTTSVEVLDFSLAAMLTAQGILPRPPSSSMRPPWILASSSIIRHNFFQGDVETHLPYVSSTRDLKKQYYKFLISDGCIIGVHNEYRTLLLDIYIV